MDKPKVKIINPKLKLSTYLIRYNRRISSERLNAYKELAEKIRAVPESQRSKDDQALLLDYDSTVPNLTTDNTKKSYKLRSPTKETRDEPGPSRSIFDRVRKSIVGVNPPQDESDSDSDEDDPDEEIDQKEGDTQSKKDLISLDTLVEDITSRFARLRASLSPKKRKDSTAQRENFEDATESVEETENMANEPDPDEGSKTYQPQEVIAMLSSTKIKLNELVIKPDIFDGTRPRPRHWWENYEDAVLANCWSHLEAIKYFSTFLSGPARDWYMTELREKVVSGLVYRLDHIKKPFKDNFLGDADYKSLCRYLSQMRQKPDESVAIFIPKVRRLLMMMDKTMSEKEQIRQITEKLRSEYQMDLARFETDTLDKLKAVCLRVEAGLAATKIHRAPSEKPQYQRGNFQQRRNYQQGRGNSSNSNFQRGQMQRSNFQQRPKSYSPTKREQSQSIQFRSETSPPKEITCYRCDRKGHYANECRSTRKLDGSSIADRKTYPKKVAMINQDSPDEDEDDDDEQTDDKVLTFKKCSQVKGKILRVSNETKVEKSKNSKEDELISLSVRCLDEIVDGAVDTGSEVTCINAKIVKIKGWKIYGRELPSIRNQQATTTIRT